MMLKKYWGIWGIFILALIVRLIFILVLGAEDKKSYDSLYDQYIYIDIARSIVAGHGFATNYDIFVADANTPTAIQPPFYPLFLAMIFWTFGEVHCCATFSGAHWQYDVCHRFFYWQESGRPIGRFSGSINHSCVSSFCNVHPPHHH